MDSANLPRERIHIEGGGMEVIDNAVPIGLIRSAVASWPAESWPFWHRYTGDHGEKLATKDPSRLTEACRALVSLMAQRTPPDDHCFPDLDLHAAGMHWIRNGGSLPLHTDAESHPLLPWTRRFSAVLFLESCEGGELLIHDNGETKSIEPRPNQLAIFPANMPHEVKKVTKGDRRTVSLFWWEATPSSGSTSAHWL